MTPTSVFLTGASSGLGRALALHYAQEGAQVYAVARREAELQVLAEDARSARGKVIPVVVDVSDAEALVAALRKAESACGGAVDLVIANAGVGRPTHARNIRWQAVKQVLDVNVSAAAVTIAAALPAMVARNAGQVVAVASLAAFRGFPGSAAYCASKAALHVFMESLRVDLRGTGVRATTIYPGFVKTEMTAKNKFKMPFLLDVDEATKVMAKGIARGDPTISYPLPLVAAVRTIGALPRSVYEELAGRMGGTPERPA